MEMFPLIPSFHREYCSVHRLKIESVFYGCRRTKTWLSYLNWQTKEGVH